MKWSELTIAMVAGDRREQEIARCALSTGATVRAFGFPAPEKEIPGLIWCASPDEALRGAHVALMPIPGITKEGALFAPSHSEKIIPTEAMMAGMQPNSHVILGWADPNLKSLCEKFKIQIHEYEWDVALMLLRAPSIVEGMLKILIETTERSIHNANICQVGQGSIGSLATRTLIALGAHVHVVARNPEQRAAAFTAGAMTSDFSGLPQVLSTADIVICSVPSRILGEEFIVKTPEHAVLVDLAAPPGSIDHEAAARCGMKSICARGLGQRAQVTVGRSQWSGIRERVEKIFGVA